MGAPGKRPAPAPGKRPAPPSKRARPEKRPEGAPSSKKKVSPPVIVYAIAFVVILILVGVTIVIGPPPRPDPLEFFPGTAFQMGLVASFLIWPIVGFWGAKRKKVPVAWAATIAYLGVTLVFGYLQLLVFGGIPMLVAAFWLTSR